MKIQPFSDIHLETGPFRPPETDADVVVAAGDIGPGLDGLEFLKGLGKPSIYVCGNHEFYDGRDLLERVSDLRTAAEGTRVHFLERAQVVIGDTRFLGATLWTDFEGWRGRSVKEAHLRMTDYFIIKAASWYTPANRVTMLRRMLELPDLYSEEDIQQYIRSGEFHPVIAYELHRESVEWLRQRLAEPFSGKTVVVTHHALSYDSLGYLDFDRGLLKQGFRRPDLLKIAAYASNLDELLRAFSIDLWVHGHTHWANDYRRHGTRVVSNPRGYYALHAARRHSDGASAPGFQADLVVDA